MFEQESRSNHKQFLIRLAWRLQARAEGELSEGPPARRGPTRADGTSPRITRLLALALKFEELIGSGVVSNYAALPQLRRVSRSRITQMTSLLNLAPDIQEEILFLRPEERSFESRSRRFGS